MTLDKNWWSDLEKLTSLCDADARKQRNLINVFFFSRCSTQRAGVILERLVATIATETAATETARNF